MMKTRLSVLVAMLLWPAAAIAAGQQMQSLVEELDRLGASTALVVTSTAIDDYALWSPGGEYLGVNVQGRWLRVDLRHIALVRGSWRGDQPIGVLSSTDFLQSVAAADVAAWRKRTRWHPRRIKTPAGGRVELKPAGLGVSLIVTRKGGKPRTLWSTALENCHSLSLSPGGRMVAFLCELNGLIVMRLEQGGMPP